jgi:hypothetical protein
MLQPEEESASERCDIPTSPRCQALPSLERLAYARPDDFDFSDHFVAGNARKSESGKAAFNRKSIGVANATGLNTDSDLPKGRLDNPGPGRSRLAVASAASKSPL